MAPDSPWLLHATYDNWESDLMLVEHFRQGRDSSRKRPLHPGRPWHDLRHSEHLLQRTELVGSDSELLQNSIEERRPDLASAVDRNGDSATICVSPTLVTSSLACR